MTSKPDKVTTKLQIREGAWYQLNNGVVGQATPHRDKPYNWRIANHFFRGDGTNEAYGANSQVSYEVTITPVMPPEPKRKVVWINFDADDYTVLHSSKTVADASKHTDRIACQKFELIEGVFDEE